MKPFIYPSTTETSRALILHLVRMISDTPSKVFNIAFSGGTTPALMFDLWANEYSDITPWERIRVFFVDERCVPPEHSESNYGLMRTLLLDVVPIPPANVFAIQGSADPACEARRYTDMLRGEVPFDAGFPVFDIVLLGVGADGHTSSIFPGQELLLSCVAPYETSFNPSNGQRRIALTGRGILAAHKIIFLVTGRAKAAVVNDIFYSGDTGPAAFIAHHAKDVEMFVDELAATPPAG